MKLNVQGQIIYVTDNHVMVNGTTGVYETEFTFDSAWDGFEKMAVFEVAGSDDIYECMLVDNKCMVPWELIQKEGRLRVGVYGVNGPQTYPTMWTEYMTIVHGTTSPTASGDGPTPSVYAQIVGLMTESRDLAEAASRKAAHAEVVAEEASDKVDQTLIVVVRYAESAEQSADRASARATDAARAANTAEVAALHYPHIGENGHWYVWDVQSEQFVDTGYSASAQTYTHNQLTPAATWEITHNLGKYPSVSVVDSGNSVVTGDVRYLDDNHLEVTFQSAFSGIAYLN